MLSRRFKLHGLFAVLLALMAQLGVGALVPRTDGVAAASVLCGSTGGTYGSFSHAPGHQPGHSSDCPVCPLCVALHAPFATVATAITTTRPPAVAVVIKVELPPPSTAPPAMRWPPVQPRAPPGVF